MFNSVMAGPFRVRYRSSADPGPKYLTDVPILCGTHWENVGEGWLCPSGRTADAVGYAHELGKSRGITDCQWIRD